MKRILGVALLSVFLAVPAFAQSMRGMPDCPMNCPKMGMGHPQGPQPCVMGSCWKGGQGGPMMRGHGGMRGMTDSAYREVQGYLENSKALGLADAQVKKLEAISDKLEADLLRERADMQVKMLAMRNLMAREEADNKTVGKAMDDMSAAWRAVQETAVKAALDARNVLTKEQREKAKALAVSPRPPVR